MAKATITIEDHPTGEVSINVEYTEDFNQDSPAHQLTDIAVKAVKLFLTDIGCRTAYADKNPFIKTH